MTEPTPHGGASARPIPTPRAMNARSRRSGTQLNGIDADALDRLAAEIAADPSRGALQFGVRTAWDGGARSHAVTRGDGNANQGFRIEADTSQALLGGDAAPNPQELLLAALNASMVVGFAAHATRAGLSITSLEIDTQGSLDLRSYLGIDPWLSPGYGAVLQRVEVRSDAAVDALQAVLDTVLATSPVLASLGRAIELQTELVVLPPGAVDDAGS